MDRNELAKQTLDQLPKSSPNAKHIVGLVKEGGRITGVGIAHRGAPNT